MMRNYRFSFVSGDQLDESQAKLKIHNPELIHQIKNVLRLKPGHEEEISFIDGKHPSYFICQLKSLEKDLAEFKILEKKNSERELEQKIHFLLPIIKADAFEFMLRKLTELGVQEFTPVTFARSQKSAIEKLKSTKNQERLSKIMQEAVEQCEGCVLPQLNSAIDLENAISQLDSSSQKLFASERLSLYTEEKTFKNSGEMVLLCGPEGGLTQVEVDFLQKNSFLDLSLGKRLLKAETAAIALFCRALG